MSCNISVSFKNLSAIERPIWTGFFGRIPLMENLAEQKISFGIFDELSFESGLCFVFCLMCLNNFVRPLEASRCRKAHDENGTPNFLVATSFLLTLIISPLLLCGFLACVIYRWIVDLIMKYLIGDEYAGLLSGPDAMWVIETTEAKSIINALLMLEIPQKTSQNEEDVLNIVREVTSRTMLSESSIYSKLRCVRKWTVFGYYYWRKIQNPDIRDFVRPLKWGAGAKFTNDELRKAIGEVSNDPLPFMNSATWEIQVGLPLLDNDSKGNIKYPIIFRVHHSVGDGVALFRLLIEGIADTVDNGYCVEPLKEENLSECGQAMNRSKYDISSVIKPLSFEPQVFMDVEISKDSSIQFKKSSNFQTDKLCNVAGLKSPVRKIISISPKPIRKIIPPVTGGQQSSSTPFFSKISLLRKIVKHRGTGKAITANAAASTLMNKQITFKKCLDADKEIENEDKCYNLSPTIDAIETKSNIQTCQNGFCESRVEFEKCANYKSNKGAITAVRSELNLEAVNDSHCFNARKLDRSILVAIFFAIALKAKDALFYLCNIFLKIEKWTLFVYNTPYALVQQIFYKPDDTVLYGKKLTGVKVVSWVSESNQTENCLRTKIRRIRSSLNGNVKFTEMLFMCLSRSLSKYYNRKGCHVPSEVNIVLPARVDLRKATMNNSNLNNQRRHGNKEFQENERHVKQMVVKSDVMSEISTLENKFTVAMLRIPIERISDGTVNDMDLIRRIQKSCKMLGQSPAFVANYLLLRWVAHNLPTPLASLFLGSAPCSLVLSNLPGPENVVTVSGRRIEDIVFWVPNRDMNGVGISILSYQGRFTIGIIADTALIPTEEEAHSIIQGIYLEVDKLEQKIDSEQQKGKGHKQL